MFVICSPRSFVFYLQTIYGNREHFATQAVLVACEYGNTKVTVKDEQAPVNVPLGVRPTLVNGKQVRVYILPPPRARFPFVNDCSLQVLCGPLPITWWGANGQLRGQKKEHEADVLCWMNAAESVYRPAVMSWVLPATSCMAFDKKVHFVCGKRDALLRNCISGVRDGEGGCREPAADAERLPAHANVPRWRASVAG